MGSSANLADLQGGGGSGSSGRYTRGDRGLDGNMDRHASIQSLRSHVGAPDSMLQKIESMASTAVRAAAKIKVGCTLGNASQGWAGLTCLAGLCMAGWMRALKEALTSPAGECMVGAGCGR